MRGAEGDGSGDYSIPAGYEEGSTTPYYPADAEPRPVGSTPGNGAV